MTRAEHFAAQVRREAAISRRTLENVPEGKGDWTPHEKSMPLGYLAALVAVMPSWVAMQVKQDSLDLKPPEGEGFRMPPTGTRAELLKAHDDAVASAVAALGTASDAHLEKQWQLKVAGKVVDENPRQVAIEDTLAHLAHHRGQLTVYLRLLGARVASVYGPTADERTFG